MANRPVTPEDILETTIDHVRGIDAHAQQLVADALDAARARRAYRTEQQAVKQAAPTEGSPDGNTAG